MNFVLKAWAGKQISIVPALKHGFESVCPAEYLPLLPASELSVCPVRYKIEARGVRVEWQDGKMRVPLGYAYTCYPK